MHPPTIREARPEEMPAVLGLILDAYSQFAPFLGDDFVEEYREEAGDVIDHPHTEVLVAEVDGHLAGTVTFYPEGHHYDAAVPPEWSCIRTLAVSPAYRGGGLGRALMQRCLDRGRSLGRQRVLLHTLSFMREAISLHESLGFRRAPEIDVDYNNTAAIAYVLDL
ncbi:MAG TPA: GNAT family N-acetyltransferase [Actinomycetota bacterium]|nr:GNAT family N-acetyltransferase [Actinomycetota bacterium]